MTPELELDNIVWTCVFCQWGNIGHFGYCTACELKEKPNEPV